MWFGDLIKNASWALSFGGVPNWERLEIPQEELEHRIVYKTEKHLRKLHVGISYLLVRDRRTPFVSIPNMICFLFA